MFLSTRYIQDVLIPTIYLLHKHLNVFWHMLWSNIKNSLTKLGISAPTRKWGGGGGGGRSRSINIPSIV